MPFQSAVGLESRGVCPPRNSIHIRNYTRITRVFNNDSREGRIYDEHPTSWFRKETHANGGRDCKFERVSKLCGAFSRRKPLEVGAWAGTSLTDAGGAGFAATLNFCRSSAIFSSTRSELIAGGALPAAAAAAAVGGGCRLGGGGAGMGDGVGEGAELRAAGAGDDDELFMVSRAFRSCSFSMSARADQSILPSPPLLLGAI